MNQFSNTDKPKSCKKSMYQKLCAIKLPFLMVDAVVQFNLFGEHYFRWRYFFPIFYV